MEKWVLVVEKSAPGSRSRGWRMEEQGGGVWTGYFFSCAVLSQGKQGFPLLRRHRLWSKARDGMISVAFAFQIHQSSDKETHSIEVLKYFFLFDTESS